MELSVEEMPDGVTKATLSGRMDIDGAASIDLRFGALAAAAHGLVVDMAGVSFLASMGIRTLMLSARNMRARGRRIALVNPQPNVEKVLRASGVDEVMPIFDNLESAATTLKG